MKTLKLFSLIAVFSLFIISCKKYDDGGTLYNASKKIENTWVIDKYMKSGADATSSIQIKSYSEEYKEDGTLIRSYIDLDDELQTEIGKWELSDDKLEVKISGLGSIKLNEDFTSITNSSLKIDKLKKDEFWYSFENGSELQEFHLKVK